MTKTDTKAVAKKKKLDGKAALNIFAKVGKFVHEVYIELKKVTWPTRKELTTNVTTVLIVVLIATVLIGALDFGAGTLYEKLISLAAK